MVTGRDNAHQVDARRLHNVFLREHMQQFARHRVPQSSRKVGTSRHDTSGVLVDLGRPHGPLQVTPRIETHLVSNKRAHPISSLHITKHRCFIYESWRRRGFGPKQALTKKTPSGVASLRFSPTTVLVCPGHRIEAADDTCFGIFTMTPEGASTYCILHLRVENE